MFVEFHSWGTGVFEHSYGLLCVFDLNAMSHILDINETNFMLNCL